MKARTTIADIAKELNITPATVSRALSNHPEISAKTKKIVKEAALRLDYDRNKIASSLRSGKTHVIGVLIPSAEHLFFGSVIHGISNLASQNGYDVLIYQSNESYAYEVKGIKTFISARVDGILASISKDTMDYAHFLEAKNKNIPIAFFDRANDDLGIPSVVIDDYQGAFLATEHLIKQGYRRIAHIAGQQHIKAFHDRLKGYKDALQAHQLPFDSSLIYQGDISIEAGKQGIAYLLSLPQAPDAVFAVEDFAALGALKALKDRGIRVPQEFGVFGFCNDLFGEHTMPTLSTIDQQTIRMGQEAFKLIFSIIENGMTEQSNRSKIVLEPIPMIRESSLKMNR